MVSDATTLHICIFDSMSFLALMKKEKERKRAAGASADSPTPCTDGGASAVAACASPPLSQPAQAVCGATGGASSSPRFLPAAPALPVDFTLEPFGPLEGYRVGSIPSVFYVPEVRVLEGWCGSESLVLPRHGVPPAHA